MHHAAKGAKATAAISDHPYPYPIKKPVPTMRASEKDESGLKKSNPAGHGVEVRNWRCNTGPKCGTPGKLYTIGDRMW